MWIPTLSDSPRSLNHDGLGQRFRQWIITDKKTFLYITSLNSPTVHYLLSRYIQRKITLRRKEFLSRLGRNLFCH